MRGSIHGKPLAAILLAVSLTVFASMAQAQYSVRNIGPGTGCQPGFNCPAPPPQTIGPPGVIVQPLPIYPQPGFPQPGYPQPPALGQPQTAPPAATGTGKSPQHIAYCMERYKSYKPETNTFTAYSGETKYCNSPYG